ncbi:MAG: patatin-like phospholipase family protein, partial [Ktedonobacterales bacterium]
MNDETMRAHQTSEPEMPLERIHPLPPDGVRRPGWRSYTAFVLSGGGARGALQVGALRALLEYGERPDVIVGTSIGAWNGVMLARTPSLAGVEQLARIWRSLTPTKVLLGRDPYALPLTPYVTASPQALAGALVVAAIGRVTRGYPSLYSDAGLRLLINAHLHDVTFEELPIPTRVIASNLSNGELAIFAHGPVEDPLLASSAIPGVFPPMRIDGQTFVDGGAMENSGVDAALALGARRIFILDVGYDESVTADALIAHSLERANSRSRTTGASNANVVHALAAVMERVSQVMGRYQLQQALQRLPCGVEAHLIRPSTPSGGGALDFGQGALWIEHAYAFTQSYLRANVPGAH